MFSAFFLLPLPSTAFAKLMWRGIVFKDYFRCCGGVKKKTISERTNCDLFVNRSVCLQTIELSGTRSDDLFLYF